MRISESGIKSPKLLLNESLANKGTVYNVESNSLADNIQIRGRDPRQRWIAHLMNIIGFDYITDVTDTIGRDKHIRIKMKDLALLYYICKKKVPHLGVIGKADFIFASDKIYNYIFPVAEIKSELTSSHIIIRYATIWSLFDLIKSYPSWAGAKWSTTNKYRRLSMYTRYFVLADVFNKLWSWKDKNFDLANWKDWIEFAASDIHYHIFDYCIDVYKYRIFLYIITYKCPNISSRYYIRG